MKAGDLIQLLVYFGVLLALTPMLGGYMAKVFTGEKHIMKPLFGWLENIIYKTTGVDKNNESNWKKYTFDLLLFNLSGFIIVYLLQVTQAYLPLNPQRITNTSWHSAFNTAVSFMTNTNWQSYAGETTLSYLTQMLGLTVQNFVSAATGIAVMIALTRGIIRKTANEIGNFWVDLTRSCIYVLLPLSIMLSIVLVSEGTIQNFKPYQHAKGLEGNEQIIPEGPAASQIAIKQLGTNGGGYFNANSAHPFENPTPFTNFLEMLAILLLPAALTYTYGKMAGSKRQGWTLFTAMMIMMLICLAASLYFEYKGSAIYPNTALMEGKETRFGITNSILWSVTTSSASNGSVNAMHESLSPMSGMIAMFNIMLGEIIFGGVGAGMYGMLVFVILTVFIAGLMIGRTPEYLGKKIEAFEVQMAIIAVLLPSACIKLFSAWASVYSQGLMSLNNAGPHGLSEILYAYSSAAGNNGSAFAGLNANTVFYNVTLGIVMLIGRFGVIVPVLAIAGSLVKKKITPMSAGTFRTDNWLFIILLISVIVIVAGLTFFPALSFGPIAEHFLMNHGIKF